MFSLDAFWASQTAGDTIRDVLLVTSSLPSWLAHSPPTAAVLQEEGPRDPHGFDQRLPELRAWTLCPQILTSKTRCPEGDWKSWTTCTCLKQSSCQNHMRRSAVQESSEPPVVAEAWLYSVRCTSPFPHDIWTEAQQPCPGSDRWPSLYCNPSAELTRDERTNDRIQSAESWQQRFLLQTSCWLF